MNRSTLRKGFTLIELLLVVIIIGIVASIALPRFASVKQSAYSAVLNSDLKTFNTTQEIEFQNANAYKIVTSCTAASCGGWTGTTTYSPSQDVTIKSDAGAAGATATAYIGYYGVAEHAKMPLAKSRCVNIGEPAATLPSTSAVFVAGSNGVQYDCTGK